LLLLVGLGVLGSIFYRTSKVEMEKLKKLQHFEEELQKNVSLQLMHNMNCSKTIKEVSVALQATATKLCYELSKKPSEFFIFSFRFTGNINDLRDKIYCGFISATYVYYGQCTDKARFICEKLANPVKTESIVMNEVPEGKM
ncbi:PREDICTED: C-type lectin domain family 12 member A-like, partial [Hipposideros armiger]|uniref:C-type lectin domain family 12 member A-like n=1 Tax=Hipposideros armiger TaxID=186990 RepID=A0A8B7QBG0_HIPAR